MKYVWQTLPKPKAAFTIRSATMRDLETGENIQMYSRNTRINVVQKCITEKGTFYRTESAMNRNLNWAFEASAFGLPNEIALSAPTLTPTHMSSPPKTKKQKVIQKAKAPKDREEPKPQVIQTQKPNFLKRLRHFWK